MGRSINIDRTDISHLIGIDLLMDIIKLPSYTNYWSHNYRQICIADCVSLKKYQQLRRFLHFADNDADDGTDGFFKICPAMEMIRKSCLSMEEEHSYSIDEQMVPYNGYRAWSRK